MGRRLEATNLAAAARHGALTPAQRKRAEELTTQLQGDLTTQAKDAKSPSLVKQVTSGFGKVVAPKETAEAQAVEAREQARAMKETKEMWMLLTKALEANTLATQTNSKGGNGGGGAPPGAVPTPTKTPRGPKPIQASH